MSETTDEMIVCYYYLLTIDQLSKSYYNFNIQISESALGAYLDKYLVIICRI